MKPYLFYLGLFCSFASTTFGIEPFGELTPGVSLRYEHKNQKSQQTTGFSELRYDEAASGDLEERLKNRKPDGAIFQEKLSRFTENGVLLSYQETDHRNGLHINNQYDRQKITTTLTKGGKSKTMSTQLSADLVPFEVLTLFLASKLEAIQQKKKITFTLFLPQLGFDTEQFTQIKVNASLVSQGKITSVRGEEPSVQILVTPASPLLQMLLPADKSQFRFTYLTNKPAVLYQFSESQTRSTLTKRTQIK